MPIFEVRQLDPFTLRNGHNAFMVVADDSAAALLVAKAETSVGASLEGAQVQVTQLGTGSPMSTAGTIDGWRFRVAVTNVGQVDVVGGASDALDDIGSALATALNGLAGISNALYTAASQTLRVAEGAADALGDETVIVRVLPPPTFDQGGERINDDIDQQASFVGSITHEGLSSADLTVVFVADSTIMPGVLWTLER